MNAQEPFAQAYDFAPIKVYLDGFGIWQKYLETLLSDTMRGRSADNKFFVSPARNDMAAMSQAGGEVFKGLVEQQIELCRFLSKRWENYLDLPDRFARCRTPFDVAQLQFEFLNKMAADYTVESAKLAKPMNRLIASCSAPSLC
jgi:hypothetical protein